MQQTHRHRVCSSATLVVMDGIAGTAQALGWRGGPPAEPAA